jgi:hypothetical protein
MLTFVTLCLVARVSYSLNDLFIGRLARRYGQVEVAAFRGASLGVSMAYEKKTHQRWQSLTRRSILPAPTADAKQPSRCRIKHAM